MILIASRIPRQKRHDGMTDGQTVQALSLGSELFSGDGSIHVTLD